MWDAFSFRVAIRHLRYGFAQTMLTIGVVALSVTLIIYINSLISGLQIRLISNITGGIAHIVISQPERLPIPAWKLKQQTQGKLYVGELERLQQRKRKIEDWRKWVPRLDKFSDQISAVSPVVEGNGFMSRGETREAVAIAGVIPERYNAGVDIQSDLTRGRFLNLNSGEVVIGYQLADDLNLKLGDKVRILSSEDVADTFTIVGIFDTGYQMLDTRTALMTLRDAQSLFQLERAVTSIDIKVRDVFQADEIARQLALQVPYEVKPWTEENRALLSALRSQTQTSRLILVFSVVAAGFGIASILITAVVSKLREIGILKAIGATSKQVIGIFTLESTIMGFLGGIVGIGIGIGASIATYYLRLASTPPELQRAVFKPSLTPGLILGALAISVAIGFLASLYPAVRAARVDPIEVIRST